MPDKKKTPSRDSDKYVVRFPEGLRNKIKVRAVENNRTMNSEIIYLLRKGVEGSDGATKAA